MPKQKKQDKQSVLLREKIQAELNQTVKNWKGSHIHHGISRNQSKISKTTRDSVNMTGNQFGCHTCGSLIKSDRNQPWIGDHIPPTNLSKAAKYHYGCPTTTVLYPQCDVCASSQSILVKKLNGLNKTTFPKLTPREENLILGGESKEKCISSSNKKVTVGEGIAIQALGVRNGCHSCNRKTPVSVYHSDHVFPQEFVTSYMPQVFDLLDIKKIDFTELSVRPQCPRCSHRQGGNLRGIAALAIKYARKNGIIVYK